ncbi:unnamed protein product [Ostreobium quekettii]|uniref:Uncharacterized protein n=1 Tax=Ostreobium quekettii TaxID=121088 RepID=A0A8S1IQD9_9CHLO|nr:unnamed protein product [Ostreobium quekettii]
MRQRHRRSLQGCAGSRALAALQDGYFIERVAARACACVRVVDRSPFATMTPPVKAAPRGRDPRRPVERRAAQTPNAPGKSSKSDDKKRKERPSVGTSVGASLLSRMSVDPSTLEEETMAGAMSVAASDSVSSPKPKSAKLDGQETLEGFLVANGFSKESATRIQGKLGEYSKPKDIMTMKANLADDLVREELGLSIVEFGLYKALKMDAIEPKVPTSTSGCPTRLHIPANVHRGWQKTIKEVMDMLPVEDSIGSAIPPMWKHFHVLFPKAHQAILKEGADNGVSLESIHVAMGQKLRNMRRTMAKASKEGAAAAKAKGGKEGEGGGEEGAAIGKGGGE